MLRQELFLEKMILLCNYLISFAAKICVYLDVKTIRQRLKFCKRIIIGTFISKAFEFLKL